MTRMLFGLWHRLLRRVGPVTLAALVLLLASTLLGSWIMQAERQAEALRLALTAKVVASRSVALPVTRAVPIAEQLSDFVATLPPLAQNASDLEQVFLSAKRRNVQLLRGEYQFKQEVNQPLATYTAIFPVHADYGSIRDFSADVLRSLPNASMEELRMTRSGAGSTVLEAVIRFSFVYRRR